MNRDEILNMPAGKEMDIYVVAFMGWQEIDKAINYRADMGIRWGRQEGEVFKFEPELAHVWKPSKEIHDAWDVVSKMIANEYLFRLDSSNTTAGEIWRAEFWKNTEYVSRFCATAPLAICRAFLLCASSTQLPNP